MAINLITQPGATTPIGNDDYTQQNLLINGALAQGDEVLTSWADTVTEPSIVQGTYFYHSGNLYQVDSADEAISGTISSGVNYIVLSVSGTTLTASYTTDISSYTFNPAYNGLYNGTDLVIKAVTYLIGTANIRGTSINKTMDGMFMLSDGSFVSSAGQFNLGDKDIVTTGDISSGDITTNSIMSGSGSLGIKWKRFTGTLGSNAIGTITWNDSDGTIYNIMGSVLGTTQHFQIGAYDAYGAWSSANWDDGEIQIRGSSALEDDTYDILVFYV